VGGRHRGKGVVELARISDFHDPPSQPQRADCGLDLLQRTRIGWSGLIEENRDSRDSGEGVLEQLQLLAVDLPPGGHGEPCDAPAGPSKAGHEAVAHGLDGQEHDDGDCLGCILGCDYRRVGSSNNDIRLEMHQFGCEIGKTVQIAIREAVVDHNVFALDPPQVPQPTLERVGHTLRRLARGNCEIADPIYLPRLTLSLADKRAKNEVHCKSDHEPDQPHEHLGGGWLTASLAQPVIF
jgi:hypothetical protein